MSLLTVFVLVNGCAGPQSTLSPAGEEAEKIANLFWIMAIGAGTIWLVVSGLAYYAMRVAPRSHDWRMTRRWVIGGGAIAPTLVLGVLLIFALQCLTSLLRPAPQGSLKVNAAGALWWWRFAYPTPDGGTVEVANEIYLPVNEPVHFELQSEDVVHAFWIPSLGGKIDMIPGRQTHLRLLPNRIGAYRGVCAEYCGQSHAHMTFDVIVTTREKFDAWLIRQMQDAKTPQDAQAARGGELFLQNGCGACHTVRGTSADGTLGPDLTHFGSRARVAAGTMDNVEANLRDWITHPKRAKPGVMMPNFDTLTPAEVDQLTAYLKGLE
ncbi:MAG: cytochrome c oxidase subunit II [Blastopirellula sp. JB062]